MGFGPRGWGTEMTGCWALQCDKCLGPRTRWASMDKTLSGNSEPDLPPSLHSSVLELHLLPGEGEERNPCSVKHQIRQMLYLTDLKDMSCVSGTYNMVTGQHPRLLMLGRSNSGAHEWKLPAQRKMTSQMKGDILRRNRYEHGRPQKKYKYKRLNTDGHVLREKKVRPLRI